MKIAYVYDAVYPYVKGGVEKRICEISRRLVKRGHQVHIFGIKWWDEKDVIIKEGVYLHGVCELKELYIDGKRSIGEAIYFARKLALPLLKEDFDVIDCQAFPYFSCFSAKISSSLNRIPLLITWHEVWDDYWYEYLGMKGAFGKTVEKMTVHLTDKAIAVSDRTKKDLERIGGGSKKEIKVIPNGIDFDKIKDVKVSDKKSDVIFVGRLVEEKNVDILIRAIKLVKTDTPDIKCIIIGDGPKKNELEKLVHDLDLEGHIEFTGFLEDYNEVISCMKSSKVFVLPSTREGFGISALEANACGLPVVTVNHKMNATCDFITDGGNGFLCELSEKDISDKIIKGLGEGKDMEKRCIERVRGRGWDEISLLVESFYGNLK